MSIVTSTGTFAIPALPSGNITGTVTHNSGDTFIVSGTTPSAFETDFKIGDYIIVGTVLRRVVGIYGDSKMEVNKAWTTSASNQTAKVLDNSNLARYMEINAIGGAITVSTEDSDNQTITNGHPRELNKNIGLGPVVIAAGSNSAEVTYT